MFYSTRRLLISLFIVSSCCAAQTATVGLSDGDEFVGPFPSWTNLKTVYGAAGDGVTDDTTALQNALNQIGTTGYGSVLYLPSGTYRITAPLTMSSVRQGISIIGQDPSNTTIKWAGASGKEMLYLDGISYAKFSRITWDGSSTALTALDFGWDGLGPYGGSTYVENSDEVFENLAYGIRGGSLGYEDSEHAILRCKFLTISRAGLSVENYNALDYYIWDSVFTNDFVGVTNTNGGGNFHVYGSLFQSSTKADIEIGPTSFFSIRQNFSQNSNAFIIADGIGSASAAITLQSNVILDTVSSPIQIENPGTVMLFDNTIRGSSGQTAPLISVADTIDSPPVPGGLVVIGNTVSESTWYSVPNGGQVVDTGNNIVARSSINPTAPTLPGALTNYNRQIFEVAPASNAAAIQQAIDQAVALNGQRPVVHVPGNYSIENTVVLPVGSDVQLVGDGGSAVGPSKLIWAGTGTGPVVRMAGPSRATIRDLDVIGGSLGTGILVENTDQTSGRVFMEQMNAQSLTQTGVFVNGLDNAQVILHNFYIDSDNLGIQVTGGPKAIAGQSVATKTDLFAGLTASNTLTYGVSSHGRLLSEDVWYEGAPAQLVDLSDSGTFTLQSAHIGAQDPGHGGTQQNVPTFAVSNFNGPISVLGAQLAIRNSIVVSGNGANTQLLALGILGPYDNSNFLLNSTSPSGEVALIDSRQSTNTAGSIPVADQLTGVSSESSFLTTMLAQARGEQAQPLSVLASGITDARFYRASISGGGTGIELDAGGPSSTTAPNISSVKSVLNGSSAATISWVTDQTADSQVFYGPSTSYGASTTLDTSQVTSHSEALQNLAFGTTYHYVVKSRSLSGYIATSADQTFTTPGNGSSSNFVTSFTPGAARNNYTGWVGMKFTVGPAVPLLSALGRIVVAGNTGTHTVKLVRASDGGDVPGASVSISMAGGTAGTFKYATLPSAIYLSANASYYLVSAEVSGGDQWYDFGNINSSNIGSVNGAVYSDANGNYVVGSASTVSFVPVDFAYQVSSSDTTPPTVSVVAPAAASTISGNVAFTASASDNVAVASVQLKLDGSNFGTVLYSSPYSATWDTTTVLNGTHTLSAVATDPAGNTTTAATVTVTVNNGSSSGTPLLTSYTAGTLRNNYSNFVGMQFTVGSSPITVTSLGRIYLTGNSGKHIVKLVQASTGVDVSGASVTITLPGGTAGQYVYGQLSAPVQLNTNTSYFLVSQETSGGDQWDDITAVQNTGVVTVNGAVYNSGSAYVLAGNTAGQSFVPANLLYTTSSSTTAPTVAVTAPTGGSTVSGSSVTISATASASAGLTIASVQFQIDGSNTGSPDTTAPYGTTFNSAALSNGTHSLTAVAVDSAGNSGLSASVEVVVTNNSPPAVSITSPSAGATITGSAQAVTATASASSGLSIASVQLQVDGSNVGSALTAAPYTFSLNTTVYGSGTHVLTAVATDSSGKAGTSAGVSVTFTNSTSPTAFISSQNSSVLRNNFSGNVGMQLTVGNSPLQVFALGRIFVTGNLSNHTVKFVLASTGADVPGGSASVAGGTSGQYTYVQLANPIILAANTAYYLVSAETLSGDQWYDLAPVGYAQVATVNGPVYQQTGGAYTFVSQLSNSYVPVNFLYLTATPTAVSISAPTAGTTVSGSAVTMSATVTAGSGVTISSVQFKIDGANSGSALTSSPYTSAFDSTKLANGSHSLTAAVLDSGGVTTTSAALTFTVANTPTSVAVTAPSAGATVTGSAATLTASATAGTGLTITSVQFKIDGANNGTALTTAPYTKTFDSTKLTNGSHTALAVALDSSGASTTSPSVSFTVSNVPTSVSVTAPAASAAVSGTAVTESANATPANGLTITSVQFKIDGASSGAALTAAPYTRTFDSTTLTNGTHSITAVALDSSSASTTSAAVSFTVNNALTSVTVTAPVANAIISGSAVTETATATPANGLTITSVQFKIDGASSGAALTAAPYTRTFDSTTLSAGTHSITAVALDSGGTSTTSAAVSVTVNNTPTSVTVTAPVANAIISGAAVTETATATPANGLTITSVQFKIDGANSGAALTAAPYTKMFDSTTLSAGTHSIAAVALDSGGTSTTSAAVSVTVNNTPTSVTVTAPTAGATVSGAAVTETATATPANGLTITSVQFKIDGANSGAALTAAPYTRTFDSTTLSAGTHSITAVALDSGGTSTTSAAVSVTVNNTPTSVTVTAPTAGATVSGAAVTETATATPANGLTITSVQFKIDGANSGAALTAAPYTRTFDSTTLSAGTHSIAAVALDSGGTSTTSAAVSVTVNNTPTSVTVTAPTAGATVSGAAVTETATATPANGLTITSVQFKIDGANSGAALTAAPYTRTFDSTTLSAGTHSITAVALDSGGTSTTSAAVSVTVNNTPTSVTVTAPTAGATVSGAAVTMTATATAGNGLTITSVQFKIDGANSGAALTAAPYTKTFDSTTLTNGTHSITAVATDSGGASTTSSAVSVTVNNAPTSVTVTAPTAGATVSGAAVTMTATATPANGLTISSLQFKIDGANNGAALTAAPYTKTFDSTTLTNGTHSITAVATDSGGASTTSSAVSVTVNNAPTSVTVTAPTAGATVSGAAVTMTATATPANGLTITSVQFKIDGANSGAALTAAPYTKTFDSTTLTNGAHSITALATDSSGASTTSAAISITVNNTVTSIAITAPTAGKTVSGAAVTMSATATPGSGLTITSVQFKIDGTNSGAALTTAPYTKTFDSTTLTNATHSITAVAVDSSQAATTSAAVSITVNNAPTGVTVTAPVAGATISGTAVTLTATAAPANGLTITSVQFKIDGTSSGAALTASPYTKTVDSTTLTNGAHSITAVALDSSGASTTSAAVSVTVNNTLTSVSVTAPTAGTTVSGAAVSMSATATPGSGLTISSVQFKIDGTNSGAALASAPYTRTFDSTTLTNGTHSISAVAVDSSGASTTSAAVGITVNNAPTSVAVTAPVTGATVSGSAVTMSATATPANGQTITSVQFKIDGVNSGVAVTTAPYTRTFDSTALTNGTHSVTAVATDSAGASAASAAVSITVSNTAATATSVTVTAPAAGATVSGAAVTLSATATPGTGLTITSVQFKIDGTSSGAALTTSPYTKTFDSTTLTNGTHSITAVAIDSSGASTTSTAISITVNNAATSVTVSAPTAGATVSGTAVTLSATATPGSGLTITSVQFKIDGTNSGAALTAAPYSRTFDSTALTNGTHSITAVALDSSSASSTSAAVSITVSNSSTAPPGTSLLTSFTKGTLRNNFSNFVGMAFTVGSSPLSVTGLGRIYVSGNTGAHVVKLVQAGSGADVQGGSVSVNVSSGTAGQITYAALASPVVLAANTSYYVVSQETAGGDMWYDITPVAGTSAASLVGPVYFNNFSYIQVSGEPNQSYVPASLLYSVISSAPPTAAITSPTSGATVSGSTVSVTATATAAAGLNISSVQFKVDGTNFGSPQTSSPYTQALNTTTLTNGAHALTAVTTDSAGNSGISPSISVTVSNTPPTVSISAPSAGTTVSGTSVTVSATATATSPLTITGVQFLVDGANISGADTTAPYSTTFNSTSLTNGSHSLTAVATDSNGNSTTSAAVSVNVSNAGGPPSGSALLTAFTPGSLRNNFTGYVGFELTVGSSPITVTGLGRIYVSGNTSSHIVKLVNASTGVDVSGGTVTVAVSSGTAGQYTYVSLANSITLAANTSYYLVSQETSAGDQWYDSLPVTGSSVASIVAPVYYTGSAYVPVSGLPNQSYVPVNLLYTAITNPPPTVSITAPVSGATISGSSVSVTASASAATGLSIASVQFKVDGVALGTDTSAPYAITLDSTTLTNGTHALTAVAVDSSGGSTTSAAISVTVSNTGTGGGTSLITGFTTATLRNNFTGQVGGQITVGASPITVTSLGRLYLSGNTGKHVVKLVLASTGVDVPGASVTVSLPSGTVGQFAYVALSSTVTLSANTSYYLMSQETSGADQWYDATPITGTGAASLDGPVYNTGSSYVLVTGLYNQSESYVPVSLLYKF